MKGASPLHVGGTMLEGVSSPKLGVSNAFLEFRLYFLIMAKSF